MVFLLLNIYICYNYSFITALSDLKALSHYSILDKLGKVCPTLKISTLKKEIKKSTSGLIWTHAYCDANDYVK